MFWNDTRVLSYYRLHYGVNKVPGFYRLSYFENFQIEIDLINIK